MNLILEGDLHPADRIEQAFGALFAGVHERAHRRHFGAVGLRELKNTRCPKIPCNRAMMHPPFKMYPDEWTAENKTYPVEWTVEKPAL